MNSRKQVWLTWTQINQIEDKRRIVFFGRGYWMEKSIGYLRKNPSYVVDNNRYEQGQVEQGLKIYKPEKLKFESKSSIFVIITTTGFQDVENQLLNYGFLPGENFCVSPSLKNLQLMSKIQKHAKSVYFTCSDQPERGGGLYRFNLLTNIKDLLLKGHCHGIARDGDHIILVDDEVGLRVMNKKLETIRKIHLPKKSRPHGVAVCEKKNRIFVVFSGRDSIGIYNLGKGKFLQEVSISDKFKKRGTPHHHLNDCAIFGDSLFVSMFSSSGNWKIGVFDGAIYEFDIKSNSFRAPAVSGLWMPHSPTIIDGVLHYCDSMRGDLLEMSWKKICNFNGFVRGIAWDGEYFYIGQSAHRYIDRIIGIQKNISLDTGITLLDKTTGLTKFFAIPDLTDINSVLFLE